MSSFITALIQQRRAAKKATPDTHGRLREIIAVLRKYNYDNGITPEITVSILQDLGPTFVKIGQIASQQTESLPPEYCEAFANLRSKVAPMDMDTVHAQIEENLGKPTSELFKSFDDKPMGSASIAQVHKAELFDGTVVAVKVRRPGIVETVARDFALIEKLIDKFGNKLVGKVDIKDMISDLEQTSKIELDLTNEANNLDLFYNNNHGRENVECPKCYRELSCEAILTEDFVTGKEVSDADFLESLDKEERRRIAALIADNFATQVLVDGFYHADPHTGNVLIKAPDVQTAEEQTEDVRENADDVSEEKKVPLPKNNIEWIDFGMMGTLSASQRQTIFDLVANVVMQDAYKVKNTLLKLAKPQGEVDHGALLDMCEGVCGQYSGTDFGDFDLGDLLNTVLDCMKEQNMKFEPFIANLARGVIALEGTVKTLSTDVNMLNFFTDKIDMGSAFDLNLEHPEEMGPEAAMKLVRLVRGITDSTSKTAETLDMLEKGQLKLNTDIGFEEKGLSNVNRLTGYAARGLIIAALLVGSSIMCLSSSLTGDSDVIRIIFRVIGFGGIGLGVFFALRLLRSIKKGK